MYLYTQHHTPRMPKHAVQLLYSEIQTFQKDLILHGSKGNKTLSFNSE